jgi:hypothetical protein
VTGSVAERLGENLRALWRQIREETATEGLLPLLRPVPPFGGPAALSPLTSLAALLGLAALSGIALGALGVLLVAAIGIHLLLTEVLGITIEVRPFR